MVCLALVLLCYAALLLPTLNRQGISWDEQTDIEIARSFLVRPGGWLRGSPSDPSQTRLPMAVVAVIYALFSADDLLTARIVSCVVGGLTVVGVFAVCKGDFDEKTGLLAGLVLATSPFFLSFARTAFTETDIFVACAFIWLLAAMSRLRKVGTLGWAAVTGVVLGLALSGKFTAVALFPAVILHVLSFPRDHQAEDLSNRHIRTGAVLVMLMTAAMTVGWFSLGAMAPGRRAPGVLRLYAILAAGGWLAVLVWAAHHRDRSISPLLLAGFVLALAVGTFMILPPVHTTNPEIIAGLMARFRHEMRWSPAFVAEAAILHLGGVVFKSSPLLGVGLLLAPVATALHWKTRPETRFPLLIVAFYMLGLLLLPLAQTFYMVPVLPILAILAADQGLNLMSHHRTLAAGLGVAVALGLGLDLALCYPDYNLNGYQWLGARYIGRRSTIGYRSIVQTPSDGVQQAAHWLLTNARPGDRVLVYLYPWHILEAASSQPAFHLIRGEPDSVDLQSDYVVVHINHRIRQRWAASEINARAASVWWVPYDADRLNAHFTKVFSVPRAFGIEMASVWERNDRIGRE